MLESAYQYSEELDEFVAAYESALLRAPNVELSAFLPAPGHRLYAAVLTELIRVELEFGWTQGTPRRLDDYRQRFPEVFQDGKKLGALTFEEFRLRRQAGQKPDPEEYRQRYGVDPADWPTPVAAAQLHSDLAPTRRVPEGVEAWALEDSAGDPLRLSVAHLLVNKGTRLHAQRPSDSPSEEELGRALRALPEAGTEFLGFQLLAELGRGAFGRVFLARQGELADRPVALKISTDALAESRTLAQLQHTNIVPIYSVHRRNGLHAVCMPFLGTITLAHVLRELRGHGRVPQTGRALVQTVYTCKSSTQSHTAAFAVGTAPMARHAAESTAPSTSDTAQDLKTLQGLTYVQAVLWLVARLADGLAHAHERGILHRDLKPANVLLTDDGQPLLLDFNLSADTKLGPGAEARVGGTLPYMAPEHLDAFRTGSQAVDARSDIYALGVILYEMLTGRHPFPVQRGPLVEMLPRMMADRGRMPDVRSGNPAVTAAVAAVVRHCLEPEPGRRYQRARQLREDLDRHLAHLPLRHLREPSWSERARKWGRRHPRLSSATGVALVAVTLLLGAASVAGVWWHRLAHAEARQQLDRFATARQEAIFRVGAAPTADKATLADIEAACRGGVA
jgi:eukaryotic-like serine/threonine-protein kinase